MCVMCENFARKHKSHYMKSNDIKESNTSIHNHNYLMGTITFEVHHITSTSPENTLATIFKSILILFAFHVLCIFFFLSKKWHNMHGYIGEKRITQLCKPNIFFLLCKCYTLPNMAFINCT